MKEFDKNFMTFMVILIGLLVFSVISVATDSLESDGYWSNYGNTENNLGRSNSIFGNMTIIENTLIRFEGSDFSPLIMDIDDDGYNEIITSDGNFIKIFNVSEDIIFLNGEYTLNGSQLVQHSSYSDIYDKIHIVTVHGETFYDYTFNGSDFNITKQLNLSETSGINTNEPDLPSTMITCADTSTGTLCFYGDINGSVNIYNPLQSNISVMIGNVSIGRRGGASSYFSPNTPIPIQNIDGLDAEEIGFIVNVDDNTFTGFIIYDLNSGTIQLEMKNIGDNIFAMTSSEGINLMFQDFDGGTSEIIFDYRAVSGSSSYVSTNISNFDGSPHGIQHFIQTDPSSISSSTTRSLIGDFTSTSGLEICSYTVMVTTSSYSLFCTNMLTGNVVYNETFTTAINIDSLIRRKGLSSADMNLDGYLDIIFYDGIFSPQSDSKLVNFSLIGNYTVPGDLNNDGNAEIISVGDGITWVAFSEYVNYPPNIDNDYEYGGYTGFYTVACVNTTQSFNAIECGLYPCNYNNDNSLDSEYIVTNCGFDVDGNPSSDYTSYLNTGSTSLASPSFDCYYNKTGTFNVRLYLLDEWNTGDYSQYNTQLITLQVIDGVAGTTCNSISNFVDSTPNTQSVASSIAEETTLSDDLLGGGTSNMKMILGLMVVIAMTVIVGYYSKNAISIISTSFFTVLIMTLIGWLAPSILVISLVGLALLLMFFLMFKPSSNEGV